MTNEQAHQSAERGREQAAAMMRDEQIDAYCEGSMSGDEAAAFERAMRDDTALAEEVRLQRSIDADLRSAFSAPAFPGLPSAAPLSAAPKGASPWVIPAWAKRAAMIALVLVGAWFALTWNGWRGLLGMPPARGSMAADVRLEQLRSGGFAPTVAASDEASARAFMLGAFGEDVAFPVNGRIKLVGWTDAGGVMGPTARALIAKVDDAPVVIFVDKRDRDRRVWLSGSSPNLHIHRRDVGGLVMYEVSGSSIIGVLGTVKPGKCW